MRRIARRIFVTLLLAMFLFAAGLSVRRFFASDYLFVALPQFSWQTNLADVSVLAANGQVRIVMVNQRSRDGAKLTRSSLFSRPGQVDPWYRFGSYPPAQTHGASERSWFGFEVIDTVDGRTDPFRWVGGAAVPLWFLVLISAVPAAWLLIPRRGRRSPTQCRHCGYDLRAGHERCPECGEESHVAVQVVVI